MTKLTDCGPYTPTEKRAITRALNIIREKQPDFYGRSKISDAGSCKDYCALQLCEGSRERFLCLFLDSQHGLISGEILFEGTINSASVYPREIIRRVLELNAAALIIAHNHPSGYPEPSQADIRLTQDIKQALSAIDVPLLDHIIVGNGQGCPTISLAQRGDL